jgi:hypothetical protein
VFKLRSGYVGFVVDKVTLGQVFSEYFGFSCQFSFHRLLYTHHVSFAAGTIGQLVADVPSGLSLTPPQGTKKKTSRVKCHNDKLGSCDMESEDDLEIWRAVQSTVSDSQQGRSSCLVGSVDCT